MVSTSLFSLTPYLVAPDPLGANTIQVSSLEFLFNPLSGLFDGKKDCFQALNSDADSNNDECEIQPIHEKASIVTCTTQQESEPQLSFDEESVISDLTDGDGQAEKEDREELELESDLDDIPVPRKLEFEAALPPAPKKRKNRVWFSPITSVVPIPSRQDYSEADRQQIWTTFDEQDMNALRNKIEYQYEGHDWRNVVLERDMYSDTNGELVHPAILEFVSLWWNRIGHPFCGFPYHSSPINESFLSIVHHQAYHPQSRLPILI